MSSAVVDRVKGVLRRRRISASGDLGLGSLWGMGPGFVVVEGLTCVFVPESKGVPAEPNMESSKPSNSSLPSLAILV